MYLVRYKSRTGQNPEVWAWQQDEMPSARHAADRLTSLLENEIGVEHEVWFRVPYRIQRNAVRVTIETENAVKEIRGEARA